MYNNGYLNRKGTNFANTTIIKMLKNIMYVGILRPLWFQAGADHQQRQTRQGRA